MVRHGDRSPDFRSCTPAHSAAPRRRDQRSLFWRSPCGYTRGPRAARTASDESMINVPQQQVPGLFHRRVGDIVVTAVSDGFLDASIDVLRNIERDEILRILTESFRPARRTAVNTFLVYSAGRLALIDTGCGGY